MAESDEAQAGSRDSNLVAAFSSAATNENIVAARYEVLDSATVAYNSMAEELHVAGYIAKSDRLNATALLLRLGAELIGGIALLLRNQREYPAGALLRQLVEVEYLTFLAYADPSQLERWYAADSETLRQQFKPQAMRKASDGLFRDQEYWLHCEVGGHPHPRARILLRAYQSPLPPNASLLPDSVQHACRLWISTRLLLPQLDGGAAILNRHAQGLTTAVLNWKAIEHPIVLTFDGVGGPADHN
ncbi:hypothetical protein [Ralstonia nicotianae]|uniref:Uncharacterized protein n=1 Tax=Ralstonia nicotianae TaxID=3037696 RepID=A0ABX7ZUV9_9RALS|nr:hypothetical protein [Ralstonia nicotianae]QUP59263.1 hypothetical protein GO999_12220 [Ralstonia nicotianae]